MKYSVVIPLKNEEENISDLIAELEVAMDPLQYPWEVICVDDGSTDGTRAILRELSEKKKNLRVLEFSRNFGQSSAFDAGFKAARGEFVITLDGDRQNDPSDIPAMISAISDADLVCGYRLNRQDPWHKKVTSWLANAFRKRICYDGVRDTGCSLKIYRTKCLSHIKMYNGMHRFLPALFVNEGFRIKEIPVKHRPRICGTTKYNLFNRSFKPIVDMFAVRWMNKRHLKYQIEKELP
ncbi:MAG: glycosyltransferase family 2 protein [Parachlamydiaceae bacterium]|nr:glycosyltransferase family 2 protein [Parachlamydiaceae bacterium]